MSYRTAEVGTSSDVISTQDNRRLQRKAFTESIRGTRN